MKTSIHLCPVKEGAQAHNERRKYLPHVEQGRSRDNAYWASDTIAHRMEHLKKMVKEKTRRAMQKKCTPILEGVLPIAPDTTMEELRDFARAMEERWGITCFQIAIHRDEGKMDKGGRVIKVNHHAHMVFDWIDHESGKTIKIGPQGAAELQTMAAKHLHMERGASSDIKHLSALQYKAQVAEERAEEIREEVDEFLKKKQAECEGMDKDLAAAKAQKKAVEKEVGNVASYLNQLKAKKTALSGDLAAAKAIIAQADEIDLESLKTQENGLKSGITALEEQVKVAKSEVERAKEFQRMQRDWHEEDLGNGKWHKMWAAVVRILATTCQEVVRAVNALVFYGSHAQVRPGDAPDDDNDIALGLNVATNEGSPYTKRLALDVLLDVAEERSRTDKVKFYRPWAAAAGENVIDGGRDGQNRGYSR